MPASRAPKSSTLYIPLWFTILAAILFMARVAVKVADEQITAQAQAALHWGDAAAIADVKAAAGKLLLIEFTADWCGPCRKMAKTTFCNRQVIDRIKSNYVPIRIYTPSNEQATTQASFIREMQEKYNATYIPCFIVAFPGGEYISRATGYYDSREFLDVLDQGLLAAQFARAMHAVYTFDYVKAASFIDGDVLSGKKTTDPNQTLIYFHILSALGREAEGKILVQRKLDDEEKTNKKIVSDHWPRALCKYLLGELSEAEALAATTRDYQKSELHFAFALSHLRSNDRPGAVRELGKVMILRQSYLDCYRSSAVWLTDFEKDK